MSTLPTTKYTHIVMTADRKNNLMSELGKEGYGVGLLKAKGFYRLYLLGYGGEKEANEIEEKFKKDAEKYNLEIIDYMNISNKF